LITQQLSASRDRAFYQRQFTKIIAKEIQSTHNNKNEHSLHAAAHGMFLAMDLDKYVLADDLLNLFV